MDSYDYKIARDEHFEQKQRSIRMTEGYSLGFEEGYNKGNRMMKGMIVMYDELKKIAEKLDIDIMAQDSISICIMVYKNILTTGEAKDLIRGATKELGERNELARIM